MQLDVTTFGADEAKLPDRLEKGLTYWNELRAARWAPGWTEFNLVDLDTDVVPYTIVVDVMAEPLDFVYRFWGTGNTVYIGYDCTGKSVRDNEMFSQKVFDECRQVCDQRRPMVFHTKALKPNGTYREYYRLRLPLSDDGKTVTKVVSIGYVARYLPKDEDRQGAAPEQR